MATHQLIHRNQSRVPPGFRFHPTDEELVGYYLHKKVSSRRIDLDVIREIDLYKMEPWDLQEKCRIGSAEQSEWYFFSHKDKKYPTGTRTNRATTAGFWKATGRDKTIHTKYSFIGMRKTLVFYKGRAPNGQKTDWIMHEYRLEEEQASNNNNNNYNNDQDGWVVCRVFKKKINLKGQKADSSPGAYDGDETTLMHSEFGLSNTNNAPNNNSYIAPSSHMFACKKEFTRMTDFSTAAAAYNDPFSRLPQLESPKLASTTPATSACMFSTGIGMQTTGFGVGAQEEGAKMNHAPIIMRHNYPPPAFALEDQFLADEHLMMTDWRTVDKLAAAQLSNQDQQHQQQAPLMNSMNKERYCVENEEYSGDVALLLRLSKQEMDLSSACGADGELWSFGRET